MIEKYLTELFNCLNGAGVNYVVLRGYKSLPNKIENDIDIGIEYNHFSRFFELLKEVSRKHNYKLKRDTVRLDLIKVTATRDTIVIKLDIEIRLSYLGLQYYPIKEMINNRSIYKDLFFVPSKNDEMAVSFLKEILHNSRVRPDKKAYILSLYNEFGFSKNIHKYFSNNSIVLFKNIMDHAEEEFFSKTSKYIRFDLLVQNIVNNGIRAVLKEMFLFILIKYLRPTYYDSKLEL